MVSSSTAVQISPNLSAVLPQSGIVATRQRTQEAAVSQQNMPAVPKLHAGSFQSFGDALDSALRHPGASGSNTGVSRPVSSGSSAANIAAGLQAEFSLSKTTGSEESDQPSSLLGMSIETLRAGMPAPEAQDPGAGMKRSAVDDESASSDPHKTPAPKSSPQIELAVPKAPYQSLPLITMGTLDNFVPAPCSEAQASESVEANTLAGNQPRSVRLTNASPAQSSAQVGNSNPQPSTPRSYGDTEAFRIDLQADTNLNHGVDLSSALASGVKLGSEPLSPAQSFGNSDQRQIQNSADAAPGNAFREKPAGQIQASAGSADGVTKSVTTAQATQPSSRQLIPNGSEEDKSSDKVPMQGADILSNSIAPPAMSFPAAGRIGKEGSDPAGNTRPEELAKLAETSAASPAKEMVVRFQGDAGEVISVRLLDQGGQVQVAVRSSDPFTAAQLRQDLSSLTSSLDRIGWKADAPAAQTPQTPTLHDTSRSDSESQNGHKASTLDWDEGPAKKKYSTSELWDKVLAGQNA